MQRILVGKPGLSVLLALLALSIFAVALLSADRTLPAKAASGVLSITAPDTVGNVGSFTSLLLDAAGNPVVSYYDVTNSDLKLLHCNDPACAGGDESITAPDTARNVGLYTSLVLDDSGNPVVSYFDSTNFDLKLLHCNDPNCAGGGDSITAPDTAGIVGLTTSLVLDEAGNPVVAYFDETHGDLKLLHCDDPNCVGSGDSITAPDTVGRVGTGPSLVLDASGNPVVSYGGSGMKLTHCNDPNCAGGNESITAPGTAGGSQSLVLDGIGNPVISEFGLNVIHCNDPNCAGGDESSVLFRERSNYTSLALDASGNPVVSYQGQQNRGGPASGLRVLHCNDADCAGGGESITAPDTVRRVGAYTSLALDASGHPVVSYYDATNGDLKLMHCGDPNCAKIPPTPTPCPGECVEPGPVGGVAFYSEPAPLGALEAAEQRSNDWGFWMAGALVALVAVVVVSTIVSGRLRSRS